jgi:hypothetical protein
LIKIGIGETISPEVFKAWLSSQGDKNQGASQDETEGNSNGFEKVIRKLQSYPILEKSPLETQQFVLNLQKEINGLV